VLLAAALAAVVGSGCTNRIGDLTLISTRNIDLSNVALDVKSGKRVRGEDCAVWPLLIPIRIPTLEGAVDDALEKGGGNIMIDQVTYQSNYTWIIAMYTCIRTEGTVLDSTAGAKP
jgi:hypothetical protein